MDHFLSYASCQRIDRLQSHIDELEVLRQTVYLNFLCLDCRDVNLLLARRASELKERLITFLIDRNRELNKE